MQTSRPSNVAVTAATRLAASGSCARRGPFQMPSKLAAKRKVRTAADAALGAQARLRLKGALLRDRGAGIAVR